MKNLLLITGLALTLSLGVAFAETLVQQVAAPLLEDGWWEVPCLDVIAFPDVDLDGVQLADDLGVLVCLRKHTHDLEPARAAFEAVVPDAAWQDIFGLMLTGEGEVDGERLVLFGLMFTGTVMIAHEADAPGSW